MLAVHPLAKREAQSLIVQHHYLHQRKTPRYDYISPGKHTRDAFRSGQGVNSQKVQAKNKILDSNGQSKRKAKASRRLPMANSELENLTGAN